MDRREFIKNSLLAASGAVFLSGCSLTPLSGGSIDVKKGGIDCYKFNNLSISKLGFGGLRLPLKKDGEVDDVLNQKMVDTAIKAGVNYFDTAYVYIDGKSEKAMGKALKKYKRDSFNLATKMPILSVKKEDDLYRIFNEQLERCKVDYFDFYLLHAVRKTNWEHARKHNIIPFLEKMKKEGKIKYLGVSHHGNDELLKEVVSCTDSWDFVQLQLNKLDWERNKADKLYKIARESKLPIVVMEPLRGGVLGMLNEESAKILKDYNPNASIASWSFRWLAGLDGIMTILSGMKVPEHLEDNIKTFKNFKPLSDEEDKIYTKAINTYLKTVSLGCTGCKYCECPIGVNIPEIFAVNNFYGGKQFIYNYEKLKESERADKCVKCGLCKTKCPQHLDIPALLAKVDKEYKALKGA